MKSAPRLKSNGEGQATNHLHHELYHLLGEHTPMEFPETLLKALDGNQW
jgi:hypothetical protein